MESNPLLELALQSAWAATDYINKHLGTRLIDVSTKSSPTDLVTHIDRETESLIRSIISQARPNDSFMGEEGGSSKGSSEITWVVDPIDGTTNFVYGFPAFAVSIAAKSLSGTQVGVVIDVARREVFHATLGKGAYMDNVQLTMATPPDLSAALIGTGFSYDAPTRKLQTLRLAELIEDIRDIRRAGAASLDLCWVACGRLDGYFEQGLKTWDFAAAALIVEEAGGKVTAIGSDQPPSSEMVIAAKALLHEQLRHRVATSYS